MENSEEWPGLLVSPSGPASPGCDAGNRIPKNRYPQYSQSVGNGIQAGESETVVEFEAQRDVLFTDLNVQAFNPDGSEYSGSISFSVTYCNTILAENTDAAEYRACCNRKPLWFMGVRESKKVRFTVRTRIPAVDDLIVVVTQSGIQGNGCCS